MGGFFLSEPTNDDKGDAGLHVSHNNTEYSVTGEYGDCSGLKNVDIGAITIPEIPKYYFLKNTLNVSI